MEFTCEMWEEQIPLHLKGGVTLRNGSHPHASEHWEWENDAEDGSFSMTYKGTTAFRIEFSDDWGIETYIVDTPDYWRWCMAITYREHFHDEVHNLESGLRLLERLRG